MSDNTDDDKEDDNGGYDNEGEELWHNDGADDNPNCNDVKG